MVPRRPGPSVRLRLTLSYAAVVVLTGASLASVVWAFLLRYVPARPISVVDGFVPTRGDLVDAFVPPALIALVGLLVAGLVGGWFLAGRVLAPLDRLAEAARRVGEGSLDHRVRLPGRRDEFRELSDAFDSMLARLGAEVAAQGRFAANASHELRTPLAVLRTQLEVARDDPHRDVEALIDRLLVVTGRATELTEALLVLSRAQRVPAVRETVDLSLVAEEAVETVLFLAEERGVEPEVEGGRVLVTGNAALLGQLVTNLVHNGVVHNRLPVRDDGAPEERTVVVRTSARRTEGGDPVAVLQVENTGPEVPTDLVATLTEPFQRGAARRQDADGGTGLGLAIVDAVVAAHGGRLVLEPRPHGGLVVTVELPAVAGTGGGRGATARAGAVAPAGRSAAELHGQGTRTGPPGGASPGRPRPAGR